MVTETFNFSKKKSPKPRFREDLEISSLLV
nr:MAG TPA: hypothetical protein [Caudoviricetes sp.]